MDQKKANKERFREISVYLVFGVLTTVVGMGTYFGILWLGEHVLHVTAEDAAFNIIRVVAQILHWVFAVLFAFFTNKKWVFTSAEDDISTVNQLLRFSASRLATLGLDTLVTFGTVWILQALDYHDVSLGFIGLDSVFISADLISKIMASVVVLITNYILSKIFVFRSKKESDTPQI